MFSTPYSQKIKYTYEGIATGVCENRARLQNNEM